MGITSRRLSRRRAVPTFTVGPNLLSGKLFTSTIADATVISSITDGSADTRWISAASSPATITVDMGARYDLDKIRVIWVGNTTKNYTIEVSDDNASWTTIATAVTHETTPELAEFTSFSAVASGQYLRVNCIDRWNSTYGNSIWEIEAYGVQSATQPPVELRDKYVWPFAATSIWNMPIGSGATYQPLAFAAPTQGFGLDCCYLHMTASGSARPLYKYSDWWPFTDADAGTATNSGVSVVVADNWIVPRPQTSGMQDGVTPNRCSAAIRADGKIQEFQYTVRETVDRVYHGGTLRAVLDLKGDGLAGLNGVDAGAHGGSYMAVAGGTLRRGELTSANPIRHALAVTINMKKWGDPLSRNGLTNCYRWPAAAADGYASTQYGCRGAQYQQPGLGMGCLLAIPWSIDLATLGFETAAGLKMANAYRTYGAYVVDDADDAGGAWDEWNTNAEYGVFFNFMGMSPESNVLPADTSAKTAFWRDMERIVTRLAIVTNNYPSSIGGGGTPRAPLAPGFSS